MLYPYFTLLVTWEVWHLANGVCVEFCDAADSAGLFPGFRPHVLILPNVIETQSMLFFLSEKSKYASHVWKEPDIGLISASFPTQWRIGDMPVCLHWTSICTRILGRFKSRINGMYWADTYEIEAGLYELVSSRLVNTMRKESIITALHAEQWESADVRWASWHALHEAILFVMTELTGTFIWMSQM